MQITQSINICFRIVELCKLFETELFDHYQLDDKLNGVMILNRKIKAGGGGLKTASYTI